MNLKLNIMKLVLIILCFSVFGVYGQRFTWCFDELNEYSDGYCKYNTSLTSEGVDLFIDESNVSNIWQIGAPQKPILDEAKSTPNVIITDTTNAYPSEDTSSFTVMLYLVPQNHTYLNNEHLSSFYMSFYYAVDSDSLNDYGMLEFSPNSGEYWFDLINEQSQYYFWSGTKPTLTGNSNGFTNARVNMLGFVHNNYEFIEGDTLLWKFTFISDDIQNNRDGLMIDNIEIDFQFPINVQDHESPSQEKEVVKVLDLLGRETEVKPNQVLIYVYSDGTREKKMVSDW